MFTLIIQKIDAGAGIKMTDFFYGDDDDGGNTLLFGKESDESDTQTGGWDLLFGDKNDENSNNYEEKETASDVYETNDSHIFGDASDNYSDSDGIW